MAIEFKNGEPLATGQEEIICKMANISPAQLLNRRAGISDEEPGPPTPDLLAAINCTKTEYYAKRAGIQEQSAADWERCERVLLKAYERSQQLSVKELKARQKEAEEAEKDKKRAENARIAAENRAKFFGK